MTPEMETHQKKIWEKKYRRKKVAGITMALLMVTCVAMFIADWITSPKPPATAQKHLNNQQSPAGIDTGMAIVHEPEKESGTTIGALPPPPGGWVKEPEVCWNDMDKRVPSVDGEKEFLFCLGDTLTAVSWPGPAKRRIIVADNNQSSLYNEMVARKWESCDAPEAPKFTRQPDGTALSQCGGAAFTWREYIAFDSSEAQKLRAEAAEALKAHRERQKKLKKAAPGRLAGIRGSPLYFF